MYRPGATFVGRENEMATLVAALEDALAGQGQLVLLAGEPGIGKSARPKSSPPTLLR